VWEDVDAKNVGTTTEKYGTKAGFAAGCAIIMASAPLATQHGDPCTHDPEIDTHSATIRCHDANGERKMRGRNFRQIRIFLCAGTPCGIDLRLPQSGNSKLYRS